MDNQRIRHGPIKCQAREIRTGLLKVIRGTGEAIRRMDQNGAGKAYQ